MTVRQYGLNTNFRFLGPYLVQVPARRYGLAIELTLPSPLYLSDLASILPGFLQNTTSATQKYGLGSDSSLPSPYPPSQSPKQYGPGSEESFSGPYFCLLSKKTSEETQNSGKQQALVEVNIAGLPKTSGHSRPLPFTSLTLPVLADDFPVGDRLALMLHAPVDASLQVIDIFRILAKAFAGRVGNLSNIVTVACGCFHDDI